MKKILKILLGCAIWIVVLLFIRLIAFTWKRVGEMTKRHQQVLKYFVKEKHISSLVYFMA